MACDYDVSDRYKPYDPGWVLVGDAAYHKDPITAQGDAMADWQLERDEGALSMYDFTCQLATLEPPPPEMQQLFAALAGRPLAMDAFVRMNAGTISPAEFFAPAHVAAMLGTPVETAFA